MKISGYSPHSSATTGYEHFSLFMFFDDFNFYEARICLYPVTSEHHLMQIKKTVRQLPQNRKKGNKSKNRKTFISHIFKTVISCIFITYFAIDTQCADPAGKIIINFKKKHYNGLH